jgi:hypothetical protein
LQYTIDISDTYDTLFRDHAAETKRVLDTAIHRALMDLDHKIQDRESRPMGLGNFRGTDKT